MKHVMHVVGARPNFMKAGPVLDALSVAGCRKTLVHTGQHYDERMSDVFFRELGLPNPDINLGIGGGTHAQQTGKAMMALETCLLDRRPDLLLVYGDVNSTLAAALASAKVGVPVAHVEAGLRSRDRSMPEELNRVLTDQVSELLFTPSTDGDDNLRSEGIPPERIHFVGNVMIDTLRAQLTKARESDVLRRLGLAEKAYALATFHRPSNVDTVGSLAGLMGVLRQISEEVPLLFPASMSD